MYKDNLPLKVDPFRFADNGLSLSGVMLVKDMSRLSLSLYSDEGSVSVDLAFGIDEQKLRYIRGHLATSLKLQCQRCLEAFEYEISGNFLSGVVHSEEEANELPSRFDPLVVTDNSLILSEMVEEELIVSLPIVPMHNIKDCKAALPFKSNPSEAVLEKENPFKVIESLRSKRDK